MSLVHCKRTYLQCQQTVFPKHMIGLSACVNWPREPLATESSHNRTRGRDLTERNFAIAKIRHADSEHGPFSADFAQNRNCFFLNSPNFAKFQGIEPPMLVDFCPFRPHSGGLSRPSGTPGPARAPGRSGAVPARPGTSPVATWLAPPPDS